MALLHSYYSIELANFSLQLEFTRDPIQLAV